MTDRPPVRVWPVMMQSWCEITFLHWRYPADALAGRLPGGLTLDTFDGWGWVGLTPFVLRALRPPLMPPLPWISQFPETNCRTYVRGPDGAQGIWFFSLDAARAPAVAGARIAYGLPYAWSEMQVTEEGNRIRYRSARRWPDQPARTRIEVEPGSAIEPRDLDIFLTARFRLYSMMLGRLTFAQVEHRPWPLRAARVIALDQTITEAAGLPAPEGEPLVHYSDGVTVRVGGPHRA